MENSIQHQDAVGRFLKTIGRYSLLAPAEELQLAHQVQRAIALEEQRKPGSSIGAWAAEVGLGVGELQVQLREGQAAKKRMVECNLRLVVSIWR